MIFQSNRCTLLAAAAAFLLLSTPVASQAARESQALKTKPTASRAFLVEAAGATAGAAVGYSAVIFTVRECEVDGDLVSCVLAPSAGAVVAGTVSSVLGAMLAGRAIDSEPSMLGAVLGAALGAGMGISINHMLREEFNMPYSRLGTVITVSVTQGIMTAAGSRFVASLRRK